MATDAEMLAAGIHLPINTDYISEGDDAISQNARVLWDRIEDVAVFRGAATTASRYETAEPGVYFVGQTAVAVAMGLPVERFGWVTVLTDPVPGRSRRVEFRTNFVNAALPAQTWVLASNGVGSFAGSEWVLEFPPESGTKLAGVALTFSRASGVDTRPLVTARLPVRFGAPVKRIRASFRNYDYRGKIPYPGAFRLNGVAWGEHQIADDGSMTGYFPEPPTILSNGMDAPADASTFSTPWVEVNAAADTDYLLSYTIEDDGIEKAYGLGFCFTNQISSGWVRDGVTTALPQSLAPLSVHLEVEVDESVPVFAYLGDSLTAGQGAARPGYDAWPQRHARAHGAIAQIYAHPGSSLREWDDATDPIWRRFAHLGRPDRLYSLLGFNDLAGTVTLADMQSRTAETLTVAMGETTTNLYLATLLPPATTAPSEAVREPFNEWLRTQLPLNAVMVSDFYRAIVDAETGLSDERWRAGPTDNHLTSAGYARIAATTVMPDPALMDTTGLLSAYLAARGA